MLAVVNKLPASTQRRAIGMESGIEAGGGGGWGAVCTKAVVRVCSMYGRHACAFFVRLETLFIASLELHSSSVPGPYVCLLLYVANTIYHLFFGDSICA